MHTSCTLRASAGSDPSGALEREALRSKVQSALQDPRGEVVLSQRLSSTIDYRSGNLKALEEHAQTAVSCHFVAE